MQYDIFISYKRKSLPTANNLYYRLTTRGYSTFFDLEEMGRDNFNVQLLSYIENAKDVFVILEEGSLDACRQNNWEKDWFCREIAYALEKKKNIIPILIGGYQMPSSDYFPAKLKELSFKNAPEFNFSFFEAYLDKLMEKEYLLSKPNLQENATSGFKFYSNETCQVFKEGKLVCSLEGMSDAPYYLPVPRKGDYRFKAVNISTADEQILKEHIDSDEEKEIEISWGKRTKPVDIIAIKNSSSHVYTINGLSFNMIFVKGGTFTMGATSEQIADAYKNEKPAHKVSLSDFFIGETVVTQELWQAVMGSNPSFFKDPIRPVVNVSWTDCQLFMKRINDVLIDKLPHGKKFRLPTEAEWEFAARGGVESKGYKYSGSNKLNEVGWYFGNSNDRSLVHFTDHYGENRKNCQVKGKNPNELGIYDMSGNVWEWCQDWFGNYESQSLINPIGPNNGYGRICRGGGSSDGWVDCRVSNRSSVCPSDRLCGLGLRLAL